MSLISEIKEQPQVLENLYRQQLDPVMKIADDLRRKEICYLFIAARGASDHAGLYAKYLMAMHNHLPTAMATPSVFSIYRQAPSLKGSLVVGISQSGKSPDICAVIDEARKQGVPTLAFTNEPQSPMALSAEAVINISAGVEKAVCATKTYTTQLMTIAMLSAALAQDEQRLTELKNVPAYVAEVLALESQIKQAVERYLFMTHCVVLGRGYNYATAWEWALKLKELAYVAAEPYSSADFLHGPIAVVEHNFPVLAVVPSGGVFDELLTVVKRLHAAKAEVVVVSDRQEALDSASVGFALPQNMPEWLSPIVAIIVGQLFSYYLTIVKKLDTESPRGLNKVTETY